MRASRTRRIAAPEAESASDAPVGRRTRAATSRRQPCCSDDHEFRDAQQLDPEATGPGRRRRAGRLDGRPADRRRGGGSRQEGQEGARDAQHPLHQHRRPVAPDGDPGGDAEPLQPADAARHDVHGLHRHDAALLPFPRDDPDRPVRPQQRRPAELLPRPQAAAERPARLAPAGRLQHRARRQVPQRLRVERGGSVRGRAGLGPLVHRAREAPLLQLEGVEERQGRATTGPTTTTT